MLNTEQDTITVINKLPLLPRDFPIFVARKNNPNIPDGYKDFKMNKTNVLICLLWVKENSSHHADTTIDYVTLNQLPKDGSTFDQLRGCDKNDDDNDEVDAGVGANEPSPEQGNTTGDVHGDETTHVTEACAVQDPD